MRISGIVLCFHVSKSMRRMLLINLRVYVNVLDDIKTILEDYYNRIYSCESQKWDLEFEVMRLAVEVSVVLWFP